MRIVTLAFHSSPGNKFFRQPIEYNAITCRDGCVNFDRKIGVSASDSIPAA